MFSASLAVPAQAASYPSCTTAKSGLTVTAYCAPNGTSYLFKLAVRCDWWTILQGHGSTYRYSEWTAPGGTAQVSCKTGQTAAWRNVMITR